MMLEQKNACDCTPCIVSASHVDIDGTTILKAEYFVCCSVGCRR